MHRNLIRWLGFSIPTVILITMVHVARDPRPGEALDGVVSGLWFTLPFVAASWLRSRFEPARAAERLRAPIWEFAFGLLAAGVAWTLLWLGWSFPETRGLRDQAFLLNSIVTGAAGLMLPTAGRRLPPDREDSGVPEVAGIV